MSCTNELFPAGGCVHLEDYKTRHGTRSYEFICAFIVACNTKNAFKSKARCCVCQLCLTYTPRLHSCLHCAFFGCYYDRHIHEHAHVTRHDFAVDVSHGAVYCFQCEDYVHDVDFISILRTHKRRMARLLGFNEQYYSWEASRTDLKLMSLNPIRRSMSTDSSIGLRGMINLGHTCFMSCVLQLLLHTPLLRDYFLSGIHICKKSSDPDHSPLSCLICEMQTLFQECYSGKKDPYVPCRILTLMWYNVKHLAEKHQQDAHDFFLSLVNVFHDHFIGGNAVSENPEDECCIIDQIFTGKKKTDIICEQCQECTVRINSFIDFSLDLCIDHEGANEAKTRGRWNDPKKKAVTSSMEEKSLLGLLENYLDGEACSRTCSSCNRTNVPTIMRHVIKKLPIIISFHLQRHQHAYKITKFVSFPEFLDMTPYLLSFQQSRDSSTPVADINVETPSSVSNRYWLFAVVKHSGREDGGHYTCYIRPTGNQWYECDDENISITNKEEVLSSEAYLLFYHKQVLEYERKEKNKKANC